MRRAVIIGVTGGFGTGKSTVAAMFRRLGAVVVDADKIAHEVILPGRPVYKKVISLFGPSILARNHRIDRKKLGKIVFRDKKRRRLLNSLIHPEVIKKIKETVKKKQKLYIIDVPLLVESELTNLIDKLVVVTTDRKTQIKRCIKKWGLNRTDVEKRITSQMSLTKKRRLADFIIDNNGSFYSTKKEVEKIWREIKNGGKI